MTRAGTTGATTWAWPSGRTCPPPTTSLPRKPGGTSARSGGGGARRPAPPPPCRPRGPPTANRGHPAPPAVRAAGSYPCVLHWIPFNENWGNPGPFQDEIVRLTRALDPQRPITDASGWTQRDLTDVIDAHDYSNNLLRQGVPNPVKPKVVGEFGGIALPVPGHTWTQGWGYQLARDPAGLLRRIRSQTTQLFEAPNLSAFVYTQLTDVEQELNGLMTYDRIPKAQPREAAAVFEGKSRSQAAAGFLRDWLVLGPIPTGTRLGSAQDSPQSRAVLEGVLR